MKKVSILICWTCVFLHDQVVQMLYGDDVSISALPNYVGFCVGALHLDMISFGSVFKSAPERVYQFLEENNTKRKTRCALFRKKKYERVKRSATFSSTYAHMCILTPVRARVSAPLQASPPPVVKLKKGSFWRGFIFEQHLCSLTLFWFQTC